MTQEQDIVERLLEAERVCKIHGLFNSMMAISEAAQTIAALRAELVHAETCWGHHDFQREAAEAKIKELEAVVSSLRQDLKRSAEAGLRVMDQRTTAIRERDDARKALAEIIAMKPADKDGDPWNSGFACARQKARVVAYLGLRRARSASSNREGGEE